MRESHETTCCSESETRLLVARKCAPSIAPVAEKARLLAQGAAQWPTSRALADPEWSQALTAARHAYPDLTQDVWTSRHNANMDVRPGGKLGTNAAAINTALGHLHDLYAEYNKLGNTRWQWVNGQWQAVRGAIGDRDFQRAQGKAEAAAHGVADELAKVFVGGTAPNVGDIEGWKTALDLPAPPHVLVMVAGAHPVGFWTTKDPIVPAHTTVSLTYTSPNPVWIFTRGTNWIVEATTTSPNAMITSATQVWQWSPH